MTAHDLATHFVENLIGASGLSVQSRTTSAMLAIQKLEQIGWSVEEIKQELDLYASTNPVKIRSVYHLEEIMNGKEPIKSLMEKDTFYYHHALRNVSSATKLKRDPASGQYIRIEEPFYLQMKARFTLQDLVSYWFEATEGRGNDHTKKQDEGRFKYLLGNYTLDEILFAIDAAKAIRIERQLPPIRNVLDLDRYMDDARVMLDSKKNMHKMNGIDKIIPKREWDGSANIR